MNDDTLTLAEIADHATADDVTTTHITPDAMRSAGNEARTRDDVSAGTRDDGPSTAGKTIVVNYVHDGHDITANFWVPAGEGGAFVVCRVWKRSQ